MDQLPKPISTLAIKDIVLTDLHRRGPIWQKIKELLIEEKVFKNETLRSSKLQARKGKVL